MTRIRSAREIRIVPPAQARARDAVHRDEDAPGGQQFGALYDDARRRLGDTGRDDTSDQHESDDGENDDGDASAHEPPAPPLPDIPPLPPSDGLALALSALSALRSERRPSPAARGIARKSDAPRKNDSPRANAEPSFGLQMIRRCAQAAEGDLLAEHLAERVAGFCGSPAVKHTGRWEVSVELDPAILPRTELHLGLSEWSLSLRFDSRDARARQLICDNGNELKTRLESRLGGRIDVSVEVI